MAYYVEEKTGQIVNCEFIEQAINQKKPGAFSVSPGTNSQIANMEYLLKAIDIANNGETSYGIDQTYATKQIANVPVVMEAVERFLKTQPEVELPPIETYHDLHGVGRDHFIDAVTDVDWWEDNFNHEMISSVNLVPPRRIVMHIISSNNNSSTSLRLYFKDRLVEIMHITVYDVEINP